MVRGGPRKSFPPHKMEKREKGSVRTGKTIAPLCRVVGTRQLLKETFVTLGKK